MPTDKPVRHPIPSLSHREFYLLVLLYANPGATSAELARAACDFGVSGSVVGMVSCLSRLGAQGYALLKRKGRGQCFWQITSAGRVKLHESRDFYANVGIDLPQKGEADHAN